MAFLQVNNVEVVGMAVTVPSTIEETVSISLIPQHFDLTLFISS